MSENAQTEERKNGTVKWFNDKKGFGFIQCDDLQEDVFVHYRNVQGDGYRSLTEGQQVVFTPAKGKKGLEAQNVTLSEG